MNTNHASLPALRRCREVEINGEKVKVGELTWHAMLELLKKLSAHVALLIKDGKFNLDQIVEVITSTGELADFIVAGATGKDAQWFQELPLGDAMEVLEAAIEINLSDTIIGRAKKAGGRLRESLGIKTAIQIAPTRPSPGSSPSSSGKDTASTN